MVTTEEATVLYREDAGVAEIRLNRPRQSNAFDLATAHLFAELVGRAAADEVTAVLITGAGKRFCAGGDLASMLEAGLSGERLTELADAVDAGFQRLAALEKPVVGAVQGAVAGAGLGLLLSCDVVVAARSTKFVMAYESVGLTPDCGVSYLLPRAIGAQRALELALTGRVLTATEAQEWGLVASLADDGAESTAAGEIAGALAKKSTFALGQAKRLIRGAWNTTRADAGRDEARTIGAAVETSAAKHLITEFGKR